MDFQDPLAFPTTVIIAKGTELILNNRLKSAVTSKAAMLAELEARARLFLQEAAAGSCHYGQYSSHDCVIVLSNKQIYEKTRRIESKVFSTPDSTRKVFMSYLNSVMLVYIM